MKQNIIKVALAKPLLTLFDYVLPNACLPPAPGCRVRVPFGRQHLIGICMSQCAISSHDKPLKQLLEVLDTEPLLSPQMLNLLTWAAGYYHHPIGEVVFAALPVASRAGKEIAPKEDPCWHLGNGNHNQLARAPQQQEALETLRQLGGQARQSQLREAGISTRVITALKDKALIERSEKTHTRVNASDSEPRETALELTREQAEALKVMDLGKPGYRCNLLQGVTGSGKTEVYLQAIDQILSQGKQALVLVPEIALTPQTLSRFRRRFGQADVIHSGLAERLRAHSWWRCRKGESHILIGTRSAIFTEFKNLGLIVVDEEHDGSFKQQDGFRYSARDLAVKRAQLLDIPLILGSATPALESLNNVLENRYQRLRLTHRAGRATPPKLRVLDIRGQTLSDGISDALTRDMTTHLSRNNQVLLFINRRGFAPAYLCSLCGWNAECPHCDSRLTLHHNPARLRCHHCEYDIPAPEQCPSCSKPGLIPVGVGTQRSETGLRARFADYPVIRLDRDSSRNPRHLEQTLKEINSGQPAILVGTQMLAKGHHFPNVTLVGILNADAGFYSSDFRAPEHTAQLIIQVSGRAGRAEKPGEVLIQTYNPDNPVLRALVQEGYEGFSQAELTTRRAAQLPPFSASALIRAEASEPEQASQWLRALAEYLKQQQTTKRDFTGVEILGPAPAPLKRRAGRFRSQALLLSQDRRALHRALSLNAEQKTSKRIRWSLDVDPYNTF